MWYPSTTEVLAFQLSVTECPVCTECTIPVEQNHNANNAKAQTDRQEVPHFFTDTKLRSMIRNI